MVVAKSDEDMDDQKGERNQREIALYGIGQKRKQGANGEDEIVDKTDQQTLAKKFKECNKNHFPDEQFDRCLLCGQIFTTNELLRHMESHKI